MGRMFLFMHGNWTNLQWPNLTFRNEFFIIILLKYCTMFLYSIKKCYFCFFWKGSVNQDTIIKKINNFGILFIQKISQKTTFPWTSCLVVSGRHQLIDNQHWGYSGNNKNWNNLRVIANDLSSNFLLQYL